MVCIYNTQVHLESEISAIEKQCMMPSHLPQNGIPAQLECRSKVKRSLFTSIFFCTILCMLLTYHWFMIWEMRFTRMLTWRSLWPSVTSTWLNAVSLKNYRHATLQKCSHTQPLEPSKMEVFIHCNGLLVNWVIPWSLCTVFHSIISSTDYSFGIPNMLSLLFLFSLWNTFLLLLPFQESSARKWQKQLGFFTNQTVLDGYFNSQMRQ